MAKRSVPSVFPATTFISGEMYAAGDIEIKGMAEADIQCRFLRIAAGARVLGRVVADRVLVLGQFAGEIRAHAVELRATADISGEVWYQTMVIEPGAVIESYCGLVTDAWDPVAPADEEMPAGRLA